MDIRASIWLFLVVTICTLFTPQVCAFERKVTQEKHNQTFSYSWQDQQDKQQTFSFTYSNDQLFNHYRRFKAFNTQEYLDTIHIKVINTIKQFDSRKYTLTTNRKARSIEYKVESDDAELLKEVESRVEQAKQQARKSYLKKHFYADMIASWAKDAVRPDVPRFVKESYSYITPISQAIKDKFGPNARPKTVINFVISWLQAMPVEPLPDRFYKSGEQFKPPLKLVRQNYGDVDSKSVLAAALLKAIYPRLRIAIITTPHHSILGLNLPIRKGEKFIDINGLKYLLVETQGPTQQSLATVNDRSWSMINSKQYIVDVI